MISLAELRAVEGQQVNATLTDGTRLEHSRLISVGRLWARTVWLLNGETDLIVSPDAIVDISVPAYEEAA